MDMHQKKEMRKNNKMNEEKSFPKTSINCLNLIYLTLFTNPYNAKGF